MRNFAKKVKIPSGNAKQNLKIPIPEKKFFDPAEFSMLSQEYLARAKTAIENIVSETEGSTVKVQHSSITLSYDKFNLHIERSFTEQIFKVYIGNGIVHNYFYDDSSERWVSTTDGHLLDELLTREITKYCQGYFNI